MRTFRNSGPSVQVEALNRAFAPAHLRFTSNRTTVVNDTLYTKCGDPDTNFLLAQMYVEVRRVGVSVGMGVRDTELAFQAMSI